MEEQKVGPPPRGPWAPARKKGAPLALGGNARPAPAFIKSPLNKGTQNFKLSNVVDSSAPPPHITLMNLYSYPTNATPASLLSYQIAVMSAHQRGEPVESIAYAWRPDTAPRWVWGNTHYRLASPVSPVSPVAAGHNPHKITAERVGDGYRLLTREEIEDRSRRMCSDTPDIDSWMVTTESWGNDYSGCCVDFTYRTKKTAGFFLASAYISS